MDRGERMPHKDKQPVREKPFNDTIKQAIEQKPFETKTSQSILLDLSAGTGLHIDTFSASTTHLWEITRIIETQSGDKLAAGRIRRHQETMTATALYLAQRINNGTITHGRDIAMALSVDLYNYGNNLINGRRTAPINFDQIPSTQITDRQTKQVDRLFAIKNNQKPNDNNENQRVLLLNDFFRSVQPHQRIADSWLQSASSDPFKGQLPENQIRANQITEALTRAIEYPVEELEQIILQQKTKSLLDIPLSPEIINRLIKSKVGVSESLQISRTRNILESLRQKGATPEEIGKKEKQIAQQIQQATTLIAHREKAKTKDIPKINYVLATTLGAALMQEAGVDCLIANSPNESAIFLTTSDNKIYFMDMTKSSRIVEITDDMIQRKSTFDITLFNQQPQHKGIRINIITGKDKIVPFTLYTPKDGHRISTFFDLAISYRSRATSPNNLQDNERTNNYQKAIEAFEKIIRPNLQDEDIWFNYGSTLTESLAFLKPTFEEKNVYLQKAANAFQQVIKLNPQNDKAYSSLGRIWDNSKDYQKAIEAYNRAVKINHKDKESKKRAKYLKKTYKFAA